MNNIEETPVNISKKTLAEKDDEIFLLKRKIELYEKKLNENQKKIHKNDDKKINENQNNIHKNDVKKSSENQKKIHNVKKSRRDEIIEYLESHIDSINLNHKLGDEKLLHDIKETVIIFKNNDYKYLQSYS